jgi:hypothetical protein
MLTNGNHDTESTADYGVPDIRNDRKAWLDQWVRGVNGGFGRLEQARSSVTVLFETQGDPGRRGDADGEGGADAERAQGCEDVPAARHAVDGLVSPQRRLADDRRADRPGDGAAVCHGYEAAVLVVPGRR